MTTTAHLEITGGIVRVFRNGGVFREPFDLALNVTGDEGIATLKALTQTPPTRQDVVAIATTLRDAGFHHIRWIRHRPTGEVLTKIFCTERLLTEEALHE